MEPGLRKPTSAARLSDVAAATGLSATAVSRHLNGKLALPPDTAARIADAVACLAYEPNQQARRLSLGRSETVGLIVPDIANPFFALLADAVERAADARGLDLLLCATRNEVGRELRALARLRHDHVDGLLFVTNHADDGSLAQAIGSGPAIVLLDEDVAGVAAPKVFADNAAGGRLAARRLLAAGHRRLAFIGGPRDLLSGMERHAGFLDEAAQAGAAVVFEHRGPYNAEAGRCAAARLLVMDDPATAVFAGSDELALGVLHAARAHGAAVPEDLSIIAFDDAGPLHLLDPPLTAVRQPIAEMGRCGLEALAARIAGASLPQQPMRLPVELIERASVTAPRAPRRRSVVRASAA